MTNQPTPQPNDDRSLVTRLDNWLDQRTGIDSILHETLDEPIPGGAKWAYVFGSGLIFLFVSQIITGICLALYYVPSADHAHTIVSYIVKEVTAGSFIRSIHAYGSSGIIILLALHIGQTILYGSYKGRRELLWLSGCILLALMLGMAFTGYLLPWDEKAYFASAVGTNLIAEVPFIGPLLQKLVRGGDQMGTLTISRFYVLHVFILPGLLIAFIAAHVFFFRKAGAAGPIKEDPVHPKLPPVPFYPRQVVIDAIFAIILIGILAIIAIKIPMDLGPRGKPRGHRVSAAARMVLPTGISVAQISQRQLVFHWRNRSACCPRAHLCRRAVSGSTTRTQAMAKANLGRRIPALPDCLHVSWRSELSRRPPRPGSRCANAEAG